MEHRLDLTAPGWFGRLETNSPLWQPHTLDGEPCLALLGNRVEDQSGGKTALLFSPVRDGTLEASLRFLAYHGQGPGGWFGVLARAQDCYNYELFWFMPNAEGENRVAYVSVAHGVVPWWTEAYQRQEKGTVPVPRDRWFRARAEVEGDRARIYVDGHLALEKALAYYLEEGRFGLYAGTLTDMAARDVLVATAEG